MSTPPDAPRPDDGDGETLWSIEKLRFHPGPLDPRWRDFPDIPWVPAADEPPPDAPPADEQEEPQP